MTIFQRSLISDLNQRTEQNVNELEKGNKSFQNRIFENHIFDCSSNTSQFYSLISTLKKRLDHFYSFKHEMNRSHRHILELKCSREDEKNQSNIFEVKSTRRLHPSENLSEIVLCQKFHDFDLNSIIKYVLKQNIQKGGCENFVLTAFSIYSNHIKDSFYRDECALEINKIIFELNRYERAFNIISSKNYSAIQNYKDYDEALKIINDLKTVSLKVFKQLLPYLDSKILDRHPNQRLNFQLKVRSLAILLLTTIIEEDINIFDVTEDNHLTFEQIQVIIKSCPGKIKLVLEENFRKTKLAEIKFGLSNLNTFFVSVLVEQRQLSWQTVREMLSQDKYGLQKDKTQRQTKCFYQAFQEMYEEETKKVKDLLKSNGLADLELYILIKSKVSNDLEKILRHKSLADYQSSKYFQSECMTKINNAIYNFSGLKFTKNYNENVEQAQLFKQQNLVCGATSSTDNEKMLNQLRELDEERKQEQVQQQLKDHNLRSVREFLHINDPRSLQINRR